MHKRYLAPAGDDGSDTGGTDVVDRGDDFTPTGDDAPEPEVKAKPEALLPDPDDEDVDPDAPDGDADPEPAVKDKKKDSRIPLDRHNKILEKERAQRAQLETQLAQYAKGQQYADMNADVTALEDKMVVMDKQYTQLLADGELDKAAALNRDIRQIERQIGESRNDLKLQAAVAQATETARYDVALERVEESYPTLNPDHDDFDPQALAEVAEMKSFYETMRKMTPTKALQAAVKKIVGQETRAQEQATEVTPQVDAKAVAAERKKAAVAATAAAAKGTPANTSKVGSDSDKLGGGVTAKDLMRMSAKDFAKIPEEALARLRGDEVT